VACRVATRPIEKVKVSKMAVLRRSWGSARCGLIYIVQFISLGIASSWSHFHPFRMIIFAVVTKRRTNPNSDPGTPTLEATHKAIKDLSGIA
jgi:hypothetical protein